MVHTWRDRFRAAGRWLNHRYVCAERIEDAVTAYWYTIQLEPEVAADVRASRSPAPRTSVPP